MRAAQSTNRYPILKQELGRSRAMKALPLDHVGIAVRSIGETLPLIELITGLSGSERERNADQGVELLFVGAGAGRLELLEPTRPDSPIARFLEKRGPGLHHLAYRVSDLQRTLDRLKADGIRLIDEAPRAGAHGRRIAFVHPSAA